jgi:hypothetical protein
MYLPIRIASEKQEEIEIVDEGFLDCGATGKFIDQSYAKRQGLELEDLENPIKVYNVDGTLNKRGTIKHYVDLIIQIHGRTCKERFLVTGLGKQKIILEFPWLKKMNPIINWEKGTLEWRPYKVTIIKQEKQLRTTATIVEEEDREAHLNSTQNPLDNDELSLLISSITGDMDDSAWINSKSTTATKIQAEINSMKKILLWKNKFQKNFTSTSISFQKKKQHDFLNLDHGITRSK